MSTIIAAVAGGETLSRTLASMPEGFAGFYATNHRDLTGLAYTLTGSWSVAEDLAQEAFVRAYRDWDRIRDYDRPDSWVRTVLVNLATSRGRRLAAEGRALVRLRGRREESHTDPLPGDAERFWGAVRALPRRQAQAVALYYHEERSVEEIATIMRCATGTVKSHLHAARRTLAERLADDATHQPAADAGERTAADPTGRAAAAERPAGDLTAHDADRATGRGAARMNPTADGHATAEDPDAPTRPPGTTREDRR